MMPDPKALDELADLGYPVAPALLHAIAAKLREAERLLTYPHLTGSYDVHWYKAVDVWLENPEGTSPAIRLSIKEAG